MDSKTNFETIKLKEVKNNMPSSPDPNNSRPSAPKKKLSLNLNKVDSKTDDKEKKNQKKQQVKLVGYSALFKYAEPFDKLVIPFAFTLSAINGIMIPAFAVIFGRVTGDFTPDKTAEQRRDAATRTAILSAICGLIILISAGGAITLWRFIETRMVANLKKIYFEKLLEHEIGWFDTHNPETITTNYAEEIALIELGSGNSIHLLIYTVFLTISGLVIGFAYGWLYSVCLIFIMPLMFIGGSGFVIFEGKKAQASKENYAKAVEVSEQALGAIKTVKMLNGEEHEINKYSETLVPAKEASESLGGWGGFFYGLLSCSFILINGFGFLIGTLFLRYGIYNWNFGAEYTATDVVSIFFAVTNGVFGLNRIGPSLQQVTTARQAAYDIYKIIEGESEIKLNEDGKKKVEDLKGEIEFRNVTFSYPSRKRKIILKDLSFKIKAGQKVAFVGETGCGKSTTIQLVERYYDVNSGEVKIDGVDIKEYNLSSLRSRLGYVVQEPKLFAMSIKKNLLLTKPGATDEELNEALKKANAYDFVMKLEKGIDTYVGSGGSQLSGGQKQRIAIARTALQNPSILLFDESTSALDRKNEREIQATLDKFAHNRTSITIAHRLSTIINSDVIFVLKQGRIIEQGTHQDLLNKQGAYAKLVKAQLGDQKNPAQLKQLSTDVRKIFHLKLNILIERPHFK